MYEKWREKRACGIANQHVFFHAESSRSVAEAKAICARCPVRIECRTWARRQEFVIGVFCGEDANERAAVLGFELSQRSPRRQQPSLLNVETVQQLYYDEGRTVDDTARAIGTSVRTLLRFMDKHKMKRRSGGIPRSSAFVKHGSV